MHYKIGCTALKIGLMAVFECDLVCDKLLTNALRQHILTVEANMVKSGNSVGHNMNVD